MWIIGSPSLKRSKRGEDDEFCLLGISLIIINIIIIIIIIIKIVTIEMTGVLNRAGLSCYSINMFSH